MAAVLPHRGRAVWVHETVEEFEAVDRSVEEGQGLRLARWGCRDFSPTTGPVSQWWENTYPTPDDLSGIIVMQELRILSAGVDTLHCSVRAEL